jgi:putative transposase
MRVIDETYLAHPFFGSRQMARWLRRQGHAVNRKRVQRLMRLMGLETIYRKPNLSRKHPSHPVFPYLLRHLSIERPNQVWAAGHHLRADQRRLHLPLRGDRLVQPGGLGLGTVEHPRRRLLRAGGAAREGQGMARRRSSTPTKAASLPPPSLPSHCWPLGVKLSMDGKGRCLDNVFVERLWRTVKYDEIYLKSYRSQIEAQTHLAAFFRFYNEQRPHGIHDRDGRHFTPMEVYHRDLPVALSA